MYKQLLVPVDGSEPSMLGLAEAIKIAKSDGSKLHLVHVVDEVIPFGVDMPGRYRAVHRRCEDDEARRSWLRRNVSCSNMRSSPKASCSKRWAAERPTTSSAHAKQCKADLIVMGTHGRRGLSRLALGSDAELVVRSSPIPVLLVRGAPTDR